jgi:nucleotide-binding universal stress UspA family protein
MSTGIDSQRIVVGVDGSPESVAALTWAAQYAKATGGTVQAVLAWHYPAVAGPGGGGIVPPEVSKETERHMRASLAEAVAKVYPDPTAAETCVRYGHPAQVLVGLSKEADLLVVGSRGHGGFTGMLLGSVSIHCVSHAQCPVTVVRG